MNTSVVIFSFPKTNKSTLDEARSLTHVCTVVVSCAVSHVMWCHMWYHMMSCGLMWCHMWYHIMSCGLMWCMSRDVMWGNAVSNDVMWYHMHTRGFILTFQCFSSSALPQEAFLHPHHSANAGTEHNNKHNNKHNNNDTTTYSCTTHPFSKSLKQHTYVHHYRKPVPPAWMRAWMPEQVSLFWPSC